MQRAHIHGAHMGTPVIAHCLTVAITLSYSKQVDSWTHEIAGAPGVPREGLAMLVSRPAQNLQFVIQKRHHESNLNDGCNPSQGEICLMPCLHVSSRPNC